MQNNKIKFINLIPSIIILLSWIVLIFLTIDSKSYILSMAYPLPYKNAFIEDISMFHIFYSVFLLLLVIISLLLPKLKVAIIPVGILFEIYSLFSPIIFKYFESENLAMINLRALFDPKNSLFYNHMLKSVCFIILFILLMISEIKKNNKTTIILFAISAVLLIGITIYQIIYISGQIQLLDSNELSELFPKSILISVMRIIPFLLTFFTPNNK